MIRRLTTEDIASDLSQDEYASFTYQGGLALAEWIEDMDEDCGTETEYDRVAIRCDFAQWESLQDWASDYFSDWKGDLDIEEEDDDDDRDEKIRNYIGDHGILIEFDGGIIVNSF